MKTKILSISMLVVITLLLSMVPFASAQTDSLAVWENIADGVLTSTWITDEPDDWYGQNDSGSWEYTVESLNVSWSVNGSIARPPGDRWYHTFEVSSNDPETGVASLQVNTSWVGGYGVIYYMDFNGTGPECYIIFYDGATMNYWNGSGWDTNVSNATDYSGDCEVDYTNAFCRVKCEWNWKTQLSSPINCQVRFKIWDPTGDEPTVWMLDENFSFYGAAIDINYYSGIMADHTWDLDPTTTDFRRIMFWDESFGLYDSTLLPEIVCPTYDAMDFWTFVQSFAGADMWNTTQLFKQWMNTWDLTSYYDENFYPGGAGDQNDTNYLFTNMLTDFQDFYEFMEPGPLPDEIPDNALILYAFETTDGTESDGDEFLIRIDSDNNGVYDSYDYAFLIHGAGGEQFYQGWTELTDPDEWYGVMTENFLDSPGSIGELFRDAGYWFWAGYINWDLLYNGSSGLPIGDDLCRMSVSFWNENDTLLTVLQNYDESNDTTILVPPREEHNASNAPTWLGFNDTSEWIYFSVDESITGEPMADPEDPPTYTPPSQQVGAMGLIAKIILELVLLFIALGLVYFVVGNWLHKTRHTIKDTMEMFKVIFVGLIILGVAAALVAMF